jgi:hypothetical protein
VHGLSATWLEKNEMKSRMIGLNPRAMRPECARRLGTLEATGTERTHQAALRRVPIILGIVLAVGALSRPAEAQQVTAGSTTAVASTFVRGVDTAADPNGNYLVLGGQGSLVGVCLNAQGTPVTGQIGISATGGYAAFPRATYSQHVNGGAGGFMVVWAEAVGSPDAMRQLFARVVSCSAGLVGPAQLVSSATWWEPGNMAIAYSPASQVFLVAWQTPEHTVKATLLTLSGAPTGPVVSLSSGLGRDPSVTWNSSTNEFGVAFSGETYSAFAVVPPWNPAGFNRNTFNMSSGILTTMTDVAYNPNTGRYIMAWFELSSGALAKVAELDTAANVVTSGVASTRLGSYDALSMAFNPVSGTFLLVGLDRTYDTVIGLELNSRGFPFNGENTLSGTTPSRYPRVSSSKVSRTWNSVFSGPNFGALSSFIATGFASSGGPAGAYGSAPTGGGGTGTSSCTSVQPGPDWTCVDGNWLPPGSGGGSTSTGSCATPSPGAGWTCVNGNWLPPSGGSTSTGSCTTVQPGPGWTCVNGNWLPPDTSSTGGTSTGSCTTPQPGVGWTCVNGSWFPPSGSTSSSSCTTVQPGPNWVCVNGNWLPGDSTSSGAGDWNYGTGGCTTVQPGSNWVCVNGNWIQSTSTSTSSCTTVQPGPNWICVNGSWYPPDTSTSSSSCTTVQPGSNWVCVNGNWIQSTSCTTVQPASNWICVNGGWVPPDSYLAPSSACTTVRPGQYWTCDAATGNWLPPQ